MIIKFPQLKQLEKIGNRTKKNHILHLIEKENVKECTLISSNENFMVIKCHLENEYCLVQNEELIQENFTNVLLVDRLDFENEGFKILKWCKFK